MQITASMMISNILNITVLSLFLFIFIALAEYSKDKVFIQQASYHALRSHYLEKNYQETLHRYTRKTTQKKFDFQSSTMDENKTKALLKVKSKDINRAHIFDQHINLTQLFEHKALYLKGKK